MKGVILNKFVRANVEFETIPSLVFKTSSKMNEGGFVEKKVTGHFWNPFKFKTESKIPVSQLYEFKLFAESHEWEFVNFKVEIVDGEFVINPKDIIAK